MLVETPDTLVDEVVVQSGESSVAMSNVEETPEPVEPEGQAINADSVTTPELGDDERRFWMSLEIKGKMAECGREIRSAESRIETLRSDIKEEKELLKGEQIRLTRLAGELADIIDGKPLPTNPNQPANSEDEESSLVNDDWRSMPTDKLLEGIQGLGSKKMEALMEIAPTAGKLEELRGEASMAHKAFREVLPKGFGQTLTDQMEDRLVEHVAKFSQTGNDSPPADNDSDDVADTEGSTNES
ncbi:hypothetical protein [Crateriforma conspicua]|uniref:Uncharacterized protein n=1 Tax=Crateriforma conspicua TaxID=2527996 RepID=A0A5C5XSX6_9PLAN|nr:hypothetical protein [Crateriforma conspicua]TWT65641.1 hypothetical protein Pan14r_51880 [Crateriforma conspicua]